MFSLGVATRFFATHYLVDPDGRRHEDLHIHHYKLELQLSAEALDGHGYVVDIDEVKAKLEAFVRRFRARELNACPEFRAKNTSLENFCALAHDELSQSLGRSVQVVMWEDEDCWVRVS